LRYLFGDNEQKAYTERLVDDRQITSPCDARRTGAGLDRQFDRCGRPAGPHRTTFLRDPDNPSYEQPQALLRALEGGAA
jgi:hypothetical protein